MKLDFEILNDRPETRIFYQALRWAGRNLFRINWFWVCLFFIFSQFFRAYLQDQMTKDTTAFAQLQKLPFWKVDIGLWVFSYAGSFFILWLILAAFAAFTAITGMTVYFYAYLHKKN